MLEEVTPAENRTDTGQAGLRVSMFGGLSVLPPARTDPLRKKEWGSDKARLLFCALLIDGPDGKGLTRDQLGDMIWPDSAPGRLANAFHIALSHLRKSLGSAGDAIVHEQGRYRIMPGQVSVDYWTLKSGLATAGLYEKQHQAHLSRDTLEEILPLYSGEFLPERYEFWILEEREWIRLEVRQALKRLAETDYFNGQYEDAVYWAQRMVSMDPADESAHRLIMKAMVDSGDRSGAVRQYQKLVKILDLELGLAPEPESTAMYTSLVG